MQCHPTGLHEVFWPAHKTIPATPQNSPSFVPEGSTRRDESDCGVWNMAGERERASSLAARSLTGFLAWTLPIPGCVILVIFIVSLVAGFRPQRKLMRGETDDPHHHGSDNIPAHTSCSACVSERLADVEIMNQNVLLYRIICVRQRSTRVSITLT